MNTYIKEAVGAAILVAAIYIGIGLSVFSMVSEAAADGPVASTNNMTTLAWDWPTNTYQTIQNQMQQVFTNPITWPALTTLVYRVYQSTNLLGSNTPWVLTATINNPPPTTNADGTVWVLLSVPIVPWNQNFFCMTTSNVLGSSFFSGLAGTPPPPPSQGKFLIQSAH